MVAELEGAADIKDRTDPTTRQKCEHVIISRETYWTPTTRQHVIVMMHDELLSWSLHCSRSHLDEATWRGIVAHECDVALITPAWHHHITVAMFILANLVKEISCQSSNLWRSTNMRKQVEGTTDSETKGTTRTLSEGAQPPHHLIALRLHFRSGRHMKHH